MLSLYAGKAQPLYASKAQPLYASKAQPLYASKAQPLYAGKAQPLYAGKAQPLYAGKARPRWSRFADEHAGGFQRVQLLVRELQQGFQHRAIIRPLQAGAGRRPSLTAGKAKR